MTINVFPVFRHLPWKPPIVWQVMNPQLDLTLRRFTEAVTARGGFVNVHDPRFCLGEKCVFHRPSFHSMLLWPKNLRETGLMERICTHGVGHPDPDSAAFFERSALMPYAASHGCDGCCHERRIVAYMKAIQWHALILRPWVIVNKLTRTEMAEGGLRRAPHCCSQGECWAHVDSPWCRCACRYCRIARRLRRLPEEPTIPSVQD